MELFSARARQQEITDANRNEYRMRQDGGGNLNREKFGRRKIDLAMIRQEAAGHPCIAIGTQARASLVLKRKKALRASAEKG